MLNQPKEKIERALGTKLGLKADRGESPKSATIRKSYRPGQHGNSRRQRFNVSDFGLQLKEKQKFKFTYGLKEKQLRDIFFSAMSFSGQTREKLAQLLEKRLDNVVFRLGFSSTRLVARQNIVHGHICVNGRKVTAPNFAVKVGDVVTFNPTSQDKALVKNAAERLKNYDAPAWLLLDENKLEGKIISEPDSTAINFDVNLVVEYYSK